MIERISIAAVTCAVTIHWPMEVKIVALVANKCLVHEIASNLGYNFAMMTKLVCLILSLLLILPLLPAYAWSEGGHHLISVLAFRRRLKAKQDKLIRILKAHPRFEPESWSRYQARFEVA